MTGIPTSPRAHTTMQNVSSRTFRAFLLLADCGQFRLAAEQLHVTQSAFSQIISKFEDQLGVRLFIRDSRHVELTAEGQHLVPRVRRLLSDFDSTLTHLRSFAQSRSSRVSLAAMAALSASWLPARIAQFQTLHPEVTVQLHDTHYDNGIKLLREGVVDFALEPFLDTLSEFHSELLFEEMFHVVCHRDHALAQRPSLQLPDLEGVRLITPSKAGGVWRQLAPLLAGVAYVDSGCEVGHYATLAGLVTQQLGVGIVPSSAVTLFSSPMLRALPLTDPGLRRRVSIISRKGQRAAPSVYAFIAFLHGAVAEQSPVGCLAPTRPPRQAGHPFRR